MKRENEWEIHVKKCLYQDYVSAGETDDPWEQGACYVERIGEYMQIRPRYGNMVYRIEADTIRELLRIVVLRKKPNIQEV